MSSSGIFGDSSSASAQSSLAASAAAAAASDAHDLELSGVIGFNGSVPHGLLLHPNDQHLIYPLGSTIVVRDLVNHTQTFLHKGGHDRAVSCMALSATGKYLASGQVTHMGFTAQVIVWNLETFEVVHRLMLHKVRSMHTRASPFLDLMLQSRTGHWLRRRPTLAKR